MIMSNEFLSKSAFYSSSLSFHSELSLSLMSLKFFSSNSSVNSLIVHKLAVSEEVDRTEGEIGKLSAKCIAF